MTVFRIAVALLALAGAAVTASAQDRDRDGLSDALEQALLARFVPTLILSAGECDGVPASFVPGVDDPVVDARDGTLYGQVTPRPVRPGEPAEVEIKYFHLWGRDCGRPHHALDVEHVSALLGAPTSDAPAEAWEAHYWYAAAHEGTICDASSGAHAGALRATGVGPYVYVSRGKHASYLERGHCKWGCGSDLCDSPGTAMPVKAVINLGEDGAPLNGASWAGSKKWALGAKFQPDFDPALRARFDDADPQQVLALRLGLRAWQSPILGGDTGLDALIVAGKAGAGAVEAAGEATATAVEATATAVEATGRAVGTAVSRALAGVARFFGIR